MVSQKIKPRGDVLSWGGGAIAQSPRTDSPDVQIAAQIGQDCQRQAQGSPGVVF